MATQRTLLTLLLASATALAACSSRPAFYPDTQGGDDATRDVSSTDDGGTDMPDAAGDLDATTREGGTVRDAGRDTAPPRDVQNVPVDGGGVYQDGGASDARECTPAGHPACTATVDWGCRTVEICNDGLDNNCDGRVDEGCSCLPGMVQRCFNGPPGRRSVGACVDGMQTCQGSGEFGCWGPCQGGIAPSAETCDDSDNDCDGCVDNHLCCTQNVGTCPSGDDPRIPVGAPFAQYTLHASSFYTGDLTNVRWHVEGGPCDQMLYATARHVSYTITGADSTDPRETRQPDLVFTPTLSGDYLVELTIVGIDGVAFDCTFIVRIRAAGFRAELCWDRTGMADIDFWVHKPADRSNWPGGGGSAAATCYYANCRNADALGWDYAPSVGGCREVSSGGLCNNPRLDIDNISTAGVPENINVDNPFDGDEFRVAVNYFGGSGPVHPMVNIYCGGELLATYGGADVNGVRYGAQPVAGFATSGGNSDGSVWRVVDVLYHGDTGSCSLTPLVVRNTNNVCVETNGDRSYDGATCARQPPPLPPSDAGTPPPQDSGTGFCF